MSKEKDFSKVKRYGVVDKHFYEETFKEVGECSYGEYVLFDDYKELFEAKAPKRQASFEELKALIERAIKEKDSYAASFFEQKDEKNYRAALSIFEESNILRRALYLIKPLTKENI